jgi:hypothetical protein
MIEDYKSLDFSSIEKKDIISKSYDKEATLGENVRVTLNIDAKKLYDLYGSDNFYIQDGKNKQ